MSNSRPLVVVAVTVLLALVATLALPGDVARMAARASAATTPAATTSAATTSAAVTCGAGTTVQTGDGPVCGTVGDGHTQWEGIPYAAAPVGDLRWRPPRPPAPWSSVLAATDPGAACPQTRGPTQSAVEDCLHLNVVAPTGAAGLPVLVWIYGGAFNEGADSLYDGIRLATAGHLVFVAFNYRVGVLGFLADSALGPDSGDYGLEDQQAALAWVRDNIAAFGGDPSRVTIAGQSAGASSVCDQLASPTASGLFRYAISDSGEYNSIGDDPAHQPQDCKATLPDEASATAAGARFAAQTGCATAADVAACLRSLPLATVLAAQQAGYGTQAPIIDQTTLTHQPSSSFAAGNVDARAVLFGVGRDENLQGTPLTEPQVTADVDPRYGTDSAAVLREYPVRDYPSPYLAYRTLIADSDTVCPALRTEALLARSARVFAYENDDSGAALLTGGGSATLPNGVYHAAELGFLFPGYPGVPALDADQQVLADQVVSQWSAFVSTGEPSAAGTPWWPALHAGPEGTVMSLQEAGDSQLTTVSQIAAAHHCSFWGDIRGNAKLSAGS